jgi:CheY-like chemotaxis protein
MYWVTLAAVIIGGSILLIWLILLHRTLRHFGVLLKDIHRRPTVSPPPTLSRPTNPESPMRLSWTPSAVPRKIVHDLNNHLGTVSGFADAALEDISNDNPVLSDLREIREAVQKAKDVVAKLDAMTRSGVSSLQPVTPYGNSEPAARTGASRKGRLLSENPLVPLVKAAFFESRDTNSKRDGSSISEKQIPSGTEHLLIVDDERQLLRMFRRFFEPLGYTVTTFSDSMEAKDAFQQNFRDYDLAIVDQRMPDLSGANLAVEMLAIRPDIPIILLSGYTDNISPADAARIGIRRFLSKPIPQVELNATVRSVLDEQPHYSV